MHFTYVLHSKAANRLYTGYTADLRKRLGEPQRGRVRWTASRLPIRLVYYEACLNQEDALPRERFLKSGKGARYLRNRLAAQFSSSSPNKLERH